MVTGPYDPAVPRDRLPPETFQLPVERLRAGYYSDAYFNYTKQLLEERGRRPVVVMQVFQKQHALLGGIDEALAVLKVGSDDFDRLTVRALYEGDVIEPFETVMTIEGDYASFAHLETVYLGGLARRSLIMSNVRDVVEAANGKPIIYFPARHDHWLVQTGDGWAAHVGGSIGVSTDAQASWWGGRGVGTVPHGLIAAYEGDTVLAAREFADRYADEMNVTVLVDFHNDSVGTSLAVARELGDRLWAVRLDTSDRLTDIALGPDGPRGVAPELVHAVRDALDGEGFGEVRIVVSGGFDAERIRRFESERVPVDAYGVGSSLIRGANDFTADVVMVDGRPCAKTGREFRPNSRLELVR
jgi:nicotinate phosphoribosyltransferase